MLFRHFDKHLCFSSTFFTLFSKWYYDVLFQMPRKKWRREETLNQDSIMRNRQFSTAELRTNDCCIMISFPWCWWHLKKWNGTFSCRFLKNKKDKSIWNSHCNITLILTNVDVIVGLIVFFGNGFAYEYRRVNSRRPNDIGETAWEFWTLLYKFKLKFRAKRAQNGHAVLGNDLKEPKIRRTNRPSYRGASQDPKTMKDSQGSKAMADVF